MGNYISIIFCKESIFIKQIFVVILSFSLAILPGTELHSSKNHQDAQYPIQTFTKQAINFPSIFISEPLTLEQDRINIIQSRPRIKTTPSWISHFAIFSLLTIMGTGAAAQSSFLSKGSSYGDNAEESTLAQEDLAKHPPPTIDHKKILGDEFVNRVRFFLENNRIDTTKVSIFFFDNNTNKIAETVPILDSWGKWRGSVYLGINRDIFLNSPDRGKPLFFEYIFSHEMDHIRRMKEFIERRDLITSIIEHRLKLSGDVSIENPAEFRVSQVWDALQMHLLEPLADQNAVIFILRLQHNGTLPEDLAVAIQKYGQDSPVLSVFLRTKYDKLPSKVRAILKEHAVSYPQKYQERLNNMTPRQRQEFLKLVDEPVESLERIARKENIPVPLSEDPLQVWMNQFFGRHPITTSPHNQLLLSAA